MSNKLPEEMTKGELLVELLHKGEANLASSSAMDHMRSRVELLEQALQECRSAAESLKTSAPEMQALHIGRIEAATNAALGVESEG